MSDHPFKKLTQGVNYHERQLAASEIRYEESRVGFLLKASGFSANAARELRGLNERETRSFQLSFKLFNREYPSYPILLGSSILEGAKLHTDSRAMLPALFKAFAATPFVAAYDEFYEKTEPHAEGRAIGLVFPRKGIRHGLVIYNEGLEMSAYHGTTLVYTGIGEKKGKKRGDRHRLFVSPFQSVVEAIHNKGHGWCPTE